MVDLGAMTTAADLLRREGGSADVEDEIAGLLEDAATELAERRREPVAQGPSAEERRLYWLGVFAPLVWANIGAGITTHETIAAKIAHMADSMLAAERAPTYPERKP